MMARPLLNHSARLLGSSGSQEQSCGQTSAQQLFLHRGLLHIKTARALPNREEENKELEQNNSVSNNRNLQLFRFTR
jgi:hypothetical protein